MEIAALVSGGVDSSVVVHQLKEAGYDPTIFYIRIGMEDKDGYIRLFFQSLFVLILNFHLCKIIINISCSK